MFSVGRSCLLATYEDELLRYATDKLMTIDGMRIFGQAAHKSGVLSFLVGDIHHYDMGMLLDRLIGRAHV